MLESKKQKEVAIIGAGEIGTALEFILREKGLTPALWDIDTKKLKKVKDFSEVIDDSEIIFLCVPSGANREIIKKICTRTKNRHEKLIITLSKGIENNSLKTMDVVLGEECKNKASYGILAGPMLAKEIIAGQPVAGVIGLSHKKWQSIIEELFRGSGLIIKFSRDMRGVAICSVLKNIYSLALGMADGLGFGNNVKSYLIVQSYHEMKEIVKLSGGKKETCKGLAGLGDLLATGWNAHSHNFTVGRNIVLKKEKNPNSEGYASLPLISEYLGKKLHKFKVLYLIKQIILEKKDAPKTFLETFKTS